MQQKTKHYEVIQGHISFGSALSILNRGGCVRQSSWDVNFYLKRCAADLGSPELRLIDCLTNNNNAFVCYPVHLFGTNWQEIQLASDAPKRMPVVNIESVADGVAFIEANPGAWAHLQLAMTVKDVEYQLQEVSACPVWNNATPAQISEIAEKVNESHLYEALNETIQYAAEEILGAETDEEE